MWKLECRGRAIVIVLSYLPVPLKYKDSFLEKIIFNNENAGKKILCILLGTVSSVQFSRSVVSDSLRPHEPQHARPPCPSPTLISIESVMPSNHLILCHPPLLLPSVFPSIRVFSSESALHIRWPKHWSFSFHQSFQ